MQSDDGEDEHAHDEPIDGAVASDGGRSFRSSLDEDAQTDHGGDHRGHDDARPRRGPRVRQRREPRDASAPEGESQPGGPAVERGQLGRHGPAPLRPGRRQSSGREVDDRRRRIAALVGQCPAPSERDQHDRHGPDDQHGALPNPMPACGRRAADVRRRAGVRSSAAAASPSVVSR